MTGIAAHIHLANYMYMHNKQITYMYLCSLPRAHAQGVKQSVCPSVIVVVVGTKIARSRVLGVCACYKHSQSVDIGEKLVFICFEFLKKAYYCYKSCIFCSACLWFIDHTHSFSIIVCGCDCACSSMMLERVITS